LPALRSNRLERCVQDSPVRIENLHDILSSGRISESEYVRPCGQYLAWDLDRLTESDCGVQVCLVSVSSELEKKSKCNDKTNDNVPFLYFHFGSSP
jgi:hypothetical protein